jgi:hypothetical protein
VPARNTFSGLISTSIILERTAAILQKVQRKACEETARRRQQHNLATFSGGDRYPPLKIELHEYA